MSMSKWLDLPEKVYHDGSRGSYTCVCYSCDAHFIGHKRDPICPDCASNIPEQLELLPLGHEVNKGKFWR